MTQTNNQTGPLALSATIGSEFALSEGFGHPWTQEPGWDLMEIQSISEDALTEAIRHTEKDGWELWIRDNTGRMGAVMYRKSSPNAEISHGGTPAK